MPPPPTCTGWVDDYFAHHLGSRMHRELLPGLRSLTTAFTIAVDGGERWAVGIDAGRITRVERGCRDPLDCHVTVAAVDFARIVSAQTTPQALFVRRRLRIEGNVLRALTAASAMEEFFRRFPFRPPTEELR